MRDKAMSRTGAEKLKEERSSPKSAARRRSENAAVELRTATRPRRDATRRKAWKMKVAPLGAPLPRIRSGGKGLLPPRWEDDGVTGASNNTGGEA